MSAKAMDVMTRNVVAVHTSASFKEIAATLRDRRVSAFPVLDDAGTVIWVVSEADLIAKEALEGVVAVRDRLSYPAPAEYVPVSGPLF